MITKRNGNGQTECRGCKEKGKFALTWDSFLYNFNDEPYCFDCLMERLEELDKENQELKEQLERVEKTNKEAIELIKGVGEMAVYTKSMVLHEEEIEELLEILDTDKGE